MATKALADCTAAELRTYATEVMNLDIAPTLNGPTIVAKLRQAGFTADFIDLPEQPAPEQAKVVNPDRKSTKPDENGYVAAEIRLQPKEQKGGDRAQYVGLNGVGMLVPRDGTASVIPIGYYRVLQDAKAKIAIKAADGITIVGWRETQRHPMETIRFLNQEQYDQYLTGQKIAS